MKKSYLALGLVAAVAMSSCSNDEPMLDNPNQPAGTENYVPVKLSLTSNTADVEVGTRGTGTVGDLKGGTKQWQYEDIYVLMTSTQDRTSTGEHDNGIDDEEWGFTSALGNGPFLLNQFDGSFWARPTVVDDAVSELNYKLDRNEWWYGAAIDRFYPMSGGSHFFAYHIDDAIDENNDSEISAELQGQGRETSHSYPTPNIVDEAVYVNFDLNGSQDLMAGYAPLPGTTDLGYEYAVKDKGFSARTARAGATPKIVMNHLLTRFTFEVVKGGNNFDRVTLNSITVNSKDKGTMCVALNPADPFLADSYANVGKIDWTADEAEDFSLMQVPDQYINTDGLTSGKYTDGTDYDVYYNIYDELYWMKPGVEEVLFTAEELAAITAASLSVGDIFDGKEICENASSERCWKKPITTKTAITYDDAKLTVKPEKNPAAQNSEIAGKAKLVTFAPVALKTFELDKDDALNNSKPIGEAMFVAPGETEYTLNLNMTYVVRDAGADEADIPALEAALSAAEADLALVEPAYTAALEALETAVQDLETAEAQLETAKTNLAADPENPALQTAVTDAENAVDAAEAAVDAAEAEFAIAKAAYDPVYAAYIAARDALASAPALLENMTQKLTVKLTQPADPTAEPNVFKAGSSYNIKITIYGYEPAQIKVELTPWIDGGGFEIGGDDNPENGDYYNPAP